MTSFQELSTITRGKEANYLAAQIRPILDEQKRRILEEMKVSYRGGTATDLSLKVGIGILVAIDDLQNVLMRDIRAAEKIQTKMLNEGNQDNDSSL